MLVRHQRSQLLERELTRGAAEAGGSRFVESLTTRVTAQRGREDERVVRRAAWLAQEVEGGCEAERVVRIATV